MWVSRKHTKKERIKAADTPQNNYDRAFRIGHESQTLPYHQPASNHIRKVEDLEKDLCDAGERVVVG